VIAFGTFGVVVATVGVALGRADRNLRLDAFLFRSKLDALGYGFLIPVFFVSSGVEYDLGVLTPTRPLWRGFRCSSLRCSSCAARPQSSTPAQSEGAARLPPRSCRPAHCPSSSPRRPSDSPSTP